MAEYSYDSIIINPSKEGIESLIGKEVYFEAKPFLCLKAANEKLASSSGILVEVYEDSINPFYVKGKSGSYRYPCIIEKKEEPKPKPKYVPFKNITEFLDAYRNTPGCLNEEAYYLSKNGIWLKDKASKSYCMVTEIWDSGVTIASDQNMTFWGKLFEAYTFLDGSPCGKEVK